MCATFLTGDVRKAPRVSKEAKGGCEIQTEKTGSTTVRNHSEFYTELLMLI